MQEKLKKKNVLSLPELALTAQRKLTVSSTLKIDLRADIVNIL